ncbi:MAG: tetratricopeptide repeat protein [Spirochaetota bacterium]|nr:tetratricopeptide repeat protein [Spirochaetota bacterium]
MPIRLCTKIYIIIALFLPLPAAAQEAAPLKFALVVGNADYTGVAALQNPLNDASDMEAILKGLGFQVEIVRNGTLEQMETAVINLKRRLIASRNSYGFFYYAGHAVESKGNNYLIPVDARIPGESMLRERAMAVQTLIFELEEAGNDLNVIVLDSCRNNPFGWSRSGSRGLAVVDHVPAGSVIVYATAAGQAALDGEGRNGLFTSQLLKNLKVPGLELQQVIRRTGADVMRESRNAQVPAVYYQYFGEAYLGSRPHADKPASQADPKAEALRYFTQSQEYANNENFPAAINAINEALRLAPADTAYYIARGTYNLMYNADPQEILADYSEAIRLSPKNAELYSLRGRLYFVVMHIPGKAIEDYTEAIRLDPSNPKWYSSRANVYSKSSNHNGRMINEAIADYNQAIHLSPDDAQLYYERGLAYELYGSSAYFSYALMDYTQAIVLSPENAQYYRTRGTLHFNRAAYAEAAADYAEAVRLQPENPETKDALRIAREKLSEQQNDE